MSKRFLAGAALVAAVVTACATAVVQNDFTIRLDTLEAPDTIARTDTLPVRLAGEVGQSDCFSVTGVEVAREDDGAVFSARGRRLLGDRACNPELVLLDTTIVLEPPFEVGEFILTGLRGREAPLEHTVVVIPGE